MLQETMRPPTAEEREVLEKRIAELEASPRFGVRLLKTYAICIGVATLIALLAVLCVYIAEPKWFFISIAVISPLGLATCLAVVILSTSDAVDDSRRRKEAIVHELPSLHACRDSGVVTVLTVDAESVIVVEMDDMPFVYIFDIGCATSLIVHSSILLLGKENHLPLRSHFVFVCSNDKQQILRAFATGHELTPSQEVSEYEITWDFEFPPAISVVDGTPSEVLAPWLKKKTKHAA